MSAVKAAWLRLLSAFRTRDLDHDFDDEAQSHLELAVEDYMRQGMPLAEAQRLARIKFGSVTAAKDVQRDARSLPWLETMLFDLRLSLRGLRRDRAFTVAAITMLTLAIGLNVTVFTVMNAMLFRGFPLVKRNDRLVYLQERFPSGACCISYTDFEDWRAQARTFDGMAFVGERQISLRDGHGRPMDTLAFTVSVNMFGLLGVPPMLGRDFAPPDEDPAAAPVAILNHRFWEARFGKRADVIGSTVYLDGVGATIIGVMPEGFDFPTKENLWMPVVPAKALLQRGLTPAGFMVVARLRDGATPQDARVELEAINRRLEADFPTTNRGIVPTVATHSETMSGRDATLTWGSLYVGAWLVLLIACANLANLVLVRTVGRWHEFATRIALGAGQGRMIRQIATECLALATVAGALAWWITNWSMRSWTVTTESRYQVLDYTVNSSTLGYLVAISIGAAVLMSLPIILRVIQLGVSGALKGGVRGVTQGLRGRRLAAGLVAGQMALAIVLLSSAGVLVRSFLNIVGADTGVRDPQNIVVGSMQLPSDKYWSVETRRDYYDRVEARLETIAGMQHPSMASTIPVKFAGLQMFEIEGHPATPEGDGRVGILRAGSDYFQVLGVSAISGREFNDGDRASGLPVAIVNESFVDRFWPGEQPLGKRLRQKNPNGAGPWRTVVGVVPDILQNDPLRQQFKPLVYVPFQQEAASRFAYFLVRTSAPPDQVTQAIRAEIERVDPDVALEGLGTLKASFAFDRDFMDADHSELGKHAKVAPVFAAIALLLSAIGLSAVIAHSVSQRTKEIGVRMAIGAAARDVRRMILREGMSPVVIGTLFGMAAAFALNRMLQSQLVGVSPYDPMTMAGAPVILVVVALVACQVPARQAIQVEPVVALRHE